MPRKVIEVDPPLESKCEKFINEIDFQDAFAVELKDESLTASEIYFKVFNHMPSWIHRLMSYRDRIVSVFGLKTNKEERDELKVTDLVVGLKVGIFKIYSIEPHEIIAGEDDSHLNFRVAVLKKDNLAIINTLVQFNNLWGRVYMTIVRPFHKAIVKAVLENAVKNNRI